MVVERRRTNFSDAWNDDILIVILVDIFESDVLVLLF
jgi:hypothetical protein